MLYKFVVFTWTLKRRKFPHMVLSNSALQQYSIPAYVYGLKMMGLLVRELKMRGYLREW